MRWNEDQVSNPPKKEEKETRELPKAGKYTDEDLMEAKKRPWLGGNYNA